MKHWQGRIAPYLCCSLLLLPAVASAQTTGSAQPAAAASTSAGAPAIDPTAMDALRKMSDYLRTLQKFEVKGNITADEVLDDDQKVQISKTAHLVVSRPNKLRLQVKADKHERLLTYDGTSFTIWSPRTRYYATVAAPPNILELAKKLEDDHDIELPLVDLFRWGTDEARVSEIKAAKDLGASECDGVTCEHYAFRQSGLDWEVWIQAGEFPLPRKVVITTLTDEARPQHAVTYNWNLAPSFNDETFVFVPPADAKKIKLADVKAMRAAANGDRQ